MVGQRRSESRQKLASGEGRGFGRGQSSTWRSKRFQGSFQKSVKVAIDVGDGWEVCRHRSARLVARAEVGEESISGNLDGQGTGARGQGGAMESCTRYEARICRRGSPQATDFGLTVSSVRGRAIKEILQIRVAQMAVSRACSISQRTSVRSIWWSGLSKEVEERRQGKLELRQRQWRGRNGEGRRAT